jgi:CRP/FNR family transcriptional regulator
MGPPQKEGIAVQLDPTAFVADDELINILEKNTTPVDCAADRVLFAQGDPPAGLYILQDGEARLAMTTPEGRPIFAVNAPKGSLLGLPGLLGNQPYTLTATAEAGSQVGFIPRDQFTDLMQREPSVALRILAVLAAEVRSARIAIH